MEKIKAGEYIKITNGMIGKVTRRMLNVYAGKEPWYYYAFNCDGDVFCVEENKILNHSINAIDLIEVGDRVNGYEIVEIKNDPFTKKKTLVTNQDGENFLGEKYLIMFREEDIETIETKDRQEYIHKAVEKNYDYLKEKGII